jgi:hypothetical protein
VLFHALGEGTQPPAVERTQIAEAVPDADLHDRLG